MRQGRRFSVEVMKKGCNVGLYSLIEQNVCQTVTGANAEFANVLASVGLSQPYTKGAAHLIEGRVS